MPPNPAAAIAAFACGSMLLGSCTLFREREHVTVSQITANPEKWAGKWLQVTGVVVYEFENLGIYESYEAYCRHDPSIYVDWGELDSIRRYTRREATVVGRLSWAVGTDNEEISTGKGGPGPLDNPRIVAWHSDQLPKCKE